jgi:hypothetical protein
MEADQGERLLPRFALPSRLPRRQITGVIDYMIKKP